MQHIFIVGSKGLPGAYGGYETFVDKLTQYHQEHPTLRYHVACKDVKTYEETYHNARCFHVKVPNIGPAQAIWFAPVRRPPGSTLFMTLWPDAAVVRSLPAGAARALPV